MTDIKLNFINESYDQNNPNVVIFQKNMATDFDEIAVAWKVIKNCNHAWQHPFVYSFSTQIGATDSWGNTIRKPKEAQNGQAFQVGATPTGDDLTLLNSSGGQRGIELLNNLVQGSITANIYKDGRLLAIKPRISPGQKAVFEFIPTLWMGVMPRIHEGQVMNSATLSEFNTEIGLLGLASADIVMTGGGSGPKALPFTFFLDNIKYA